MTPTVVWLRDVGEVGLWVDTRSDGPIVVLEDGSVVIETFPNIRVERPTADYPVGYEFYTRADKARP